MYVLSSEYTFVSRIARSQNKSTFNMFTDCQTIFQSGCTIFHCYQQCMRVSILQILINSFYYLLDNTNPHRCEVVSYGFLVGISLVANDVEHLLMGLLTICKLTIEKYLLRSFAHFLI